MEEDLQEVQLAEEKLEKIAKEEAKRESKKKKKALE